MWLIAIDNVIAVGLPLLLLPLIITIVAIWPIQSDVLRRFIEIENVLIIQQQINPSQHTVNKSHVDADEKFLLILPYEGITNQLFGILRGMALAHLLNYSLVVPPLTRSQHEDYECPVQEEWSSWIALPNIVRRHYGGLLKIVEMTALRELLPSTIPVFSYGRWRWWRVFGRTTHNFFATFLEKTFILNWRPFRAPLHYLHLMKYHQTKDNSVLAIAQLQHVHFPTHLIPIPTIKDLLPCRPSLRVPLSGYVGVHWRRGDFALACKNKPNQRYCYPKVLELIIRLMRVKKKYGYSHIWLAGNAREKELKEIGDFLALANMTLIMSNQKCTGRYMDDLCHLINSNIFLGNPYSYLSRLVSSIRFQTQKRWSLPGSNW